MLNRLFLSLFRRFSGQNCGHWRIGLGSGGTHAGALSVPGFPPRFLAGIGPCWFDGVKNISRKPLTIVATIVNCERNDKMKPKKNPKQRHQARGVSLPPEQEAYAVDRARECGMPFSRYIQRLIALDRERDLLGPLVEAMRN